jgi:carboxy-terminal domain RNA polymerase II polypeptide A small phosphatase
MAAAEVYSPTVAAAQQQQRGKVASQAWRAVVGWIGFFLQVLLQILRGTPSCAQLLSFVGFRYPLLSGTAASEPSPEVAFMPLHSEIPADAAPAPKPASEPLGRLTVRRFGFLFVSVELLMSGVGENGAFVKYMGFNQIV